MCGEACVEGVKWMSDSYQMGLVCLKSDRLALERLLAGYKGSAQLVLRRGVEKASTEQRFSFGC